MNTPWKINMEHTNHPFWKENYIPNLYEDMFQPLIFQSVYGTWKYLHSPTPTEHPKYINSIFGRTKTSSLVTLSPTYCWWFQKSQTTTWHLWNPAKTFFQLVLAGFLQKPSKVSMLSLQHPAIPSCFCQPMIITPKPPNFSDKRSAPFLLLLAVLPTDRLAQGPQFCPVWQRTKPEMTRSLPKKDFTITKSGRKTERKWILDIFQDDFMILLSTYLLIHNLIPDFFTLTLR